MAPVRPAPPTGSSGAWGSDATPRPPRPVGAWRVAGPGAVGHALDVQDSRGWRASASRFADRWPVSVGQLRLLAQLTTLFILALIITGGIVRLTGSGLGCPTWPDCTAGHFVAADRFHALVEFGNRVFTFLVSLGILATALASLFVRPFRRDLVLWSWVLVGFVIVEAVLGGVSVLFKLLAPLVMAHFLLAVLMLGAAWILVRRADSPTGRFEPVVPRPLRVLGRIQVVALLLVMATGTVVTGAGPHSGSVHAVGRLPLSFEDAAQLHADMAWLFGGISLVLLLLLHLQDIGGPIRRLAHVAAGLAVLQGTIGYCQYFFGDPAWLVGFHVAFAAILFSLVSWCNLLTRRPVPAEVGERAAVLLGAADRPAVPVAPRAN